MPDEPLQIVILLPRFTRIAVGGYKVAYSYANYLSSRGHKVTICHADFIPGGVTQPASLRSLAIALVGAAHRRRRPEWFALDERIRLVNTPYLSKGQLPAADIVVATAAQTAPFAARLASEAGIPGIYFIQHFEDWAASADFVNSTWRLPLVRVVIAPWLAERGNDLGVSTVLVPNAIDSSEFPPGPPIVDRSNNVLAMVSTHEWKRTDLVIEVFTKLKKRNADLTAITFGACPRPPGLPAFVTHLDSPSREILAKAYQSSQVYLCSSDSEGWHLPPAEAMSSGAAVASTDIPGVAAYALGIALFSPPGDPVGLESSVQKLLTDPCFAQDRADLGKNRMRSYTPTDAAAAFEKALLSAKPTLS